MKTRALQLLAALESGCETREQIFAHQGCFSLLNNAAAELRGAGIDVVCTLEDGAYRYRLLDEPRPLHNSPEAGLIERPDDRGARWQRIREACGPDAASYIDLDHHADSVVRMIETSTKDLP